MNATDRLADCGRRPNCVSSAASNPRRRVGPWRLRIEPDDAWLAIEAAVGELPRTRIVERVGDYLRAESRSRIFRFVDDLELLLDRDARRLAVRSASRVGISDRGVNRRRVGTLHEVLVAVGAIEP